MNKAHPNRNYGKRAAIFGIMAATVYAVMVLITLRNLQSISGVLPFDMRPTGYSYADAQLLLERLGATGRQYYLTRQLPLDIFYPPLLAYTLTSAFLWCGIVPASRGWIGFGIVLAWTAALADYCENIGIAALLLQWPDISTGLVTATSLASMVKAGTTMLAITVLLVVLARTVWRRARSQPAK